VAYVDVILILLLGLFVVTANIARGLALTAFDSVHPTVQVLVQLTATTPSAVDISSNELVLADVAPAPAAVARRDHYRSR
jgi:hypothetical protein